MIDRLRAHGKGVILVTHRLQEISDVADRATALRDGRYAGTLERADFSREALAELVVGRTVEQHLGPRHSVGGERLVAENLMVRSEARPVDLVVRERELVAIVGLVGSGVSTIVQVLAGALPTPRDARLVLDGDVVRFNGPGGAQGRGIGFVSADRKGEGIVPLRSSAENMAIASLRRFSAGPFTRRSAMRREARVCRDLFDIKWTSPDQPIGSLSGGNQQKVVLSRWHVRGSTLLVIQEPSQGVDIGARRQIHDYLVNFAHDGGAVLFSSSDLDEVRDIAHRIYVVHSGEVVAEFRNDGEHQVSRGVLTQAMAAMVDSSGQEIGGVDE
jgi:ABC-type sugar transport system ATPase subunit